MKRILQAILFLCAANTVFAQAFRTPTFTGNAFTDFTANERIFFMGGGNYNLTWDATNLYVGVGGLGTYIKDEPNIMYLDTDPAVSPVGGTGSLTGQNYDGRVGTLPFTSNLVLYLKNGYAEVRTTTGTNWTVNTYNNVTANIVTGANDIEVRIPWSIFPGGVRPLAFRSLFFKENGGGGTDAYNIMPNDAYIPDLNATPFAANGFFTSWNTNAGAMNNTLTATCTPPMLTLASDVTVDFNDYRGAGFTTKPLLNIGQLCTNTWATTGWSDSTKVFGSVGSFTTIGDHARGLRAAPVGTGGFYAVNKGGTDYGFLIQPSGGDFTPGTLTLKIQNTTGFPLTSYQVMYDVLEFNDQPRANSFNFSYSSDNATYTPVAALNHTTTAAAAATPAFVTFPKNATVSGISVPNNGFFYLRWTSTDVSGVGARDEIVLDNIIVKKLASFPYCLPTGAACGSNFVREMKLLNGTTPILTNTTSACNNSGYTFFNALPIPNLGRLSTYGFDLTASAPGDFGNYSIWIDYNQDGDFDDAGEFIAGNTTNGATASSTGTFIVPNTALVGNTRMRVAFTDIAGGTPVLTSCNAAPSGEYEDYTVNILACTTPLVAICKNVTVTMNTASVTVPASDLNNLSTGCAPLTFSTVNNTFTCADIGTKTLTLTVKDANNAMATCTSTVTVKDGTACGGTIAIKDPCTCKAPSTNLKNGQFDDKVEITASVGQIWRIQSVSGYFKPTSPAPPAAPIPYIVGDVIPAVAAGSNKYELEGIHIDSIGYSLVAERVDAAGTVLQVLSIGNKCYYPTPIIVGLDAIDCYPLNSPALTLSGIDKNGGVGTATFKIDGAPATVLNPVTLGIGSHVIEITFDAGLYNATTGINPPLSDPGCIEKTTKTINVSAAVISTLSCLDHVNFSLEAPACKLEPNANQLITTGGNCKFNYKVKLFNGINPIDSILTEANLNKIYTFKVIDPNNGNSCWGTLKLEDKTAPIFTNCPIVPVDKNCEDLSNLIINTNNPNQPAGNILASTGSLFPISITDCQAYTATYSDNVKTNACSNPISSVITRTIKAVDNQGNISTCMVTINVKRRDTSAVKVITPIKLTCADIVNGTVPPSVSNSPYILNSTGGRVGIYPINQNSCDFVTTYTDVISPTCGNAFTIIRTWVIIDCIGFVKRIRQDILVEDKTVPTFASCDTTSIRIALNGNNCDVDNYTPKLPKATDNCDNAPKVTVKIVNASNTQIAAGNTMSDIPVGTYKIVYTATDACGNNTICSRNLIVEDKSAPVAVCDLNTKVSLSSDGQAVLAAETVNDGSNDNCCLDLNSFLIKRMSESDISYRKNIIFTCADTATMILMQVADCYGNKNVCMVNIRVEDKLPPVAFGRDTVVCCANTPSATAWLNANPIQQKSLIDYPTTSNPGYYDNCSATAKAATSGSIDNCGNGKVTQTWTVKDPSGLSATTTVNYISENRSAYTVTFPADITLTCNSNKIYATDVNTTGKPAIANLGKTCPLVGVEYKDEIFKVVPDACFKIIRTWKVLNWCQPQPQNDAFNPDRGLNGNAKSVRRLGTACAPIERTFTNIDLLRPDRTSSVTATGAPCQQMMQDIIGVESACSADYQFDTDGYMEYTQIIKVIDLTAPTLVAGKVTTEAVGKECKTRLTIEKPTSTDCTGATADSYEIVRVSDNSIFKAGNIFSTPIEFTESQFGAYIVRFKTTDQCGNFNSTDVKVTIKDIKKPTPICHNWIAIELMATKMVMLDAKLIDAGSYDNCTIQSKLKFKIQVPAPDPKTVDVSQINPDTLKTTHTFICPPAGTVANPNNPNAYFITVALWVGDEAGNWDYCETVVNVQDNMDICGYSPIQMKPVAGEVMTETQKEVENVMVKLDGMKKGQFLTTPQGQFKFADLPVVGNYTVTPEKDVNPLNGVSTLDLVLISKHILAVQPLTSPYKIIAADANHNGTVTTADMVELRKMILGIQNNFTQNTSWRFVDKSFVFPEPESPWFTVFPESKSFTGLLSNSDANFVAIKVGDVSGNATPTGQAAGRNEKGTFQLNTDEQTLKVGEDVKVKMNASEMTAFLGYQMTLAYNQNMLELVDIQGDIQNFGTPESGFVTYSQSDNKDANYTLVFRAKTNGTLSQAISINSRYTSAEAYNLQGETYNVALNFKGKQNENLTLYQNRPNPFDGTTSISFNMPARETARIIITDVSGKIVKTIENEYAKGYNEISINKSDLGTSGVFYYRLETATENLTKKMIVIE